MQSILPRWWILTVFLGLEVSSWLARHQRVCQRVTPPLAVVVLQVRSSSIMTMSSMGSKPRRVPNRELRPAETNIPAPVHGQEILSEPEEREKRWKEELDEKMAAEEEKRELLGVPQVVLGKVLLADCLSVCLGFSPGQHGPGIE